jgi:hypothetical protein
LFFSDDGVAENADHRNQKIGSVIKPWTVKKELGYERPKTIQIYCALENLGGKIQFMI